MHPVISQIASTCYNSSAPQLSNENKTKKAAIARRAGGEGHCQEYVAKTGNMNIYIQPISNQFQIISTMDEQEQDEIISHFKHCNNLSTNILLNNSEQ